MENASKALIIAGSVLITIMIIALGVTIFNKAKSSSDTSNLDTAEINMFNSKFERYDGNQSGSQVKSLLSSVISNASTNSEDTIKLVGVKYFGEEGTLQKATYFGEKEDVAYYSTVQGYVNNMSAIKSMISPTHTYNVELNYNADTGLIDIIEIHY